MSDCEVFLIHFTTEMLSNELGYSSIILGNNASRVDSALMQPLVEEELQNVDRCNYEIGIRGLSLHFWVPLVFVCQLRL